MRPDELTGDTKREINGMSNRDQINTYLKNPAKMPDPKESLKDKIED